MRSGQDPLTGPVYDMRRLLAWLCGPLMRAYERVWRRWPGRPWTHVARDWMRHWPLAWLAGFLVVGVVLGRYLTWRVLVGAAVALPVGFVLGHLFW